MVTFRNDPQYKPLHVLPLNRLPVHDHLHLVPLLVKAQVIADLERLRSALDPGSKLPDDLAHFRDGQSSHISIERRGSGK